ncbi:radical SAM protein [candidate division LCP-89 bacterium B3_LCP]|uniref:Radical SAM protein n=1 Tax=candidate division LCP-89 bacterium B3_LCP TaxID=2012998 RepID=A0A532V5V4_UNCL8|nr:MAG: radical SAM protein [candidate division LCP-89 bacterium B3_LCP]
MIRLLPTAKMLQVARCLYKNRKNGAGIYPFYASLKVTDLCGFRCSFCNVWRNPAPDLDTEGIIKVLRNLGDSSIVLTSIEGGEPLLRKDIEIILKEASQQPYYLLFTTSVRNLLDYPLETYSKWIDLFHVSIDEGHENLELFDILPEIVDLPWIVCVQTVVRDCDMGSMAEKVKTCADNGAKILIMPAVELDDAKHSFPDPARFSREVADLKKRFPRTVLTPRRYLDAINGESHCSAASIIIDSDGGLFYPCRTLNEKPVNLTQTDLMGYLESQDASERRSVMKTCDRLCGWYQYFAIDFFTQPGEVLESLGPYWGDLIGWRSKKASHV